MGYRAFCNGSRYICMNKTKHGSKKCRIGVDRNNETTGLSSHFYTQRGK